jgi:hypothetical protein
VSHVVSFEHARSIALSLPETCEHDHHGLASFRVGGKVFATVPDDDHLRIMVGEAEIRAAAARDPQRCREFYWGARLACVVVDLDGVRLELLTELLTEAWLRQAPKATAAAFLDPR